LIAQLRYHYDVSLQYFLSVNLWRKAPHGHHGRFHLGLSAPRGHTARARGGLDEPDALEVALYNVEKDSRWSVSKV